MEFKLNWLAVDGVSITFNAALNKPAYQISDYVDVKDVRHAATLANDGARLTTSRDCAVSERESDPWWAVDLEEPQVVTRVDITNSAEHGIRVLVSPGRF